MESSFSCEAAKVGIYFITEQALIRTQDYKSALYLQLQLALREYIGTLTIDELLAKKEAVAEYILELTTGKAKE